MLIPPYFRFRQTLFADDPEVCGIVYPVLATTDGHTPTLVSRWQNFEYLLADLEFHFLDKTHSVLRPHGAVSLWEITTLITILLKHNTHFKGEDIMEGRIVHEMHWTSQTKRLRLDKHCPFATIVPQAYFWPQVNLYTQRVRSWKEAQFLYCWDLNIRPLLTIWNRNPLSTLSIKWSQLYNCYTQLLHVIRYPIMGVAASEPSFWVIFAMCIGLQQGVALLFNYFKAQPEVRNDLTSVLTYPLYKQLDNLMGTLGALRTLLISMPAKSDSYPLKEQLKRKANTWPLLPSNSDSISDSSSDSDDDKNSGDAIAASSSSLAPNHIRFFKTEKILIQPVATQLSPP